MILQHALEQLDVDVTPVVKVDTGFEFWLGVAQRLHDLHRALTGGNQVLQLQLERPLSPVARTVDKGGRACVARALALVDDVPQHGQHRRHAHAARQQYRRPAQSAGSRWKLRTVALSCSMREIRNGRH